MATLGSGESLPTPAARPAQAPRVTSQPSTEPTKPWPRPRQRPAAAASVLKVASSGALWLGSPSWEHETPGVRAPTGRGPERKGDGMGSSC